jgi:hypothetical protein
MAWQLRTYEGRRVRALHRSPAQAGTPYQSSQPDPVSPPPDLHKPEESQSSAVDTDHHHGWAELLESVIVSFVGP